MYMFHNLADGLRDALQIWRREMELMFRDEGVIIFFFVVPLLYPLLYSWIYNNEVVREVPVAVVDESHTALSREFLRQIDASPDVKIISHCTSLDDARSLVSRQVARGVVLIDGDFDRQIGRGEQATVSLYCDMSSLLPYKALFQTAQNVALGMGATLRAGRSGAFTGRDAELAAQPLKCESVPLFNPSGGYGTFIIPGVLVLIIQQTLLLGIGLLAGTARETNRTRNLIPFATRYHGMFRIVSGKALAYFMVYAVMSAWLVLGVPRLFGFLQTAHVGHLVAVMLPFLLASIFFGMALSCLVRYRENVLLLVVFLSVPLLFMSGISWPQSHIPGLWQGVSWLFPSTFCIRAFVRINSMGAVLGDVLPELYCLWAQTAAYLALALGVYRWQIYLAERSE